MKRRSLALSLIVVFVLSLLNITSFMLPTVKAGDTSSVSIQLSGGPTKTKSYLGEDIEVKLKLTPTGQINVQRSPVSVVLIIDSSGSMQDRGKMTAAKDAAKNLIDSFKSSAKTGDKLGLIDFDSYVNDGSRYYRKINTTYYGPYSTSNTSTTNLVDLTNGSSVNTVKGLIDNMSAYGGTNMEAALNKANTLLSSSPSGNEKYVIMVTDGMPTFYMTSETRNGYPVITGPGNQSDSVSKSKTLSAVQSLAQNGTKVFVVGVDTTGADIDRDFIDDMASTGNGKAYYISNTNALNSILQDIFRIINMAVSYDNITVEYPIPAGLTVTSMPSGWTVENGKLKGSFNPITFTNGGGTPSAQELSFKISSNVEGIYNLGKVTVTYKRYDTVNGETSGTLELNLGQVEFVRRPGISATFQIIGTGNIVEPDTPYNAKLTISAYGKSLDIVTVINNFVLSLNNEGVTLQKVSTSNPAFNYAVDSGPTPTSVTIDYRVTFTNVGSITLNPVLNYQINETPKVLNLTPISLFVFDSSNIIEGFSITKKMISDNSTANLSVKIDDMGLFSYDSSAKIEIMIEMEPANAIITNVTFPLKLTVDRNTRVDSTGLRVALQTVNFKVKPNQTAAKVSFNISQINLIVSGTSYTTPFEKRINDVVVKKAVLR
ncbi:VWA domain-containing protein [Caldicellulosiruptor changbaiensis]|uniref:VWA domain-containing protein n=1 Tax=Caldicellulosiruptor changbaiensis TaxID=1222016 RepID=A0A3T0D7P3_9FIRM|nr:vWA domain-containing protein [Caldicellulosiruptor changbaiensis]AZT90852.1 VWA domain-containing protein [Caldicellulosiruptor changbaiensis]